MYIFLFVTFLMIVYLYIAGAYFICLHNPQSTNISSNRTLDLHSSFMKEKVCCNRTSNQLWLAGRTKCLEDKKEEIWLSPMTKAPTTTDKSKTQRDNTKHATKNFDYITIGDRLRTVSWGNDSHLTAVVKPVQQRCNQNDTRTGKMSQLQRNDWRTRQINRCRVKTTNDSK